MKIFRTCLLQLLHYASYRYNLVRNLLSHMGRLLHFYLPDYYITIHNVEFENNVVNHKQYEQRMVLS